MRPARRFGLALVLGLSLAALSEPEAHARKSPPYSMDEIRSVESDREAKIRELREQEITQLRIALGRRLAKRRMADLYFRTAELYLEAYRIEFLLEARVHQKRLTDGRPDPFIDRSHSKEYLRRGLKASEAVLRLKIPYEKLDHIYYFLGFNHREMGNRKESVRHYRELAAKFPRSPFVSEALRELGDAAFEAKNFNQAQKHYEQALRHRPPEGAVDQSPRILHRLAWSYYRTRQLDRAIETMKRAVRETSKDEEKFVSLRDEALRDMALLLTERGDLKSALAYFDDVAGDKDYYAQALESLGKEYERNGEPDKAVQVYEALLKVEDQSEESRFNTIAKLVDLDLRRARYPRALRRVRDLSVPSKMRDHVAFLNLKAMIRRTGTENHDRYRKSREKGPLQVANDFYSAYLESFLKQDDPRKETPEIQMYLAEVKRELGQAKEASALYRRVIESRDKRYTKEAGALWAASLSDALKASAPQGSQRKSERGQPSEIELQFVEASDELQDLLPESPEAREAAIRSAQLLAGYSSTQDQARSRAVQLMERYPQSAQGVTAARLWLQILTDKLPDPQSGRSKEYESVSDDLKEAIQDLRENATLLESDKKAGAKLAQQMSDIERKLRIGGITLYEKDRDFAAAARAYEAVAAEEASKSEKAHPESASLAEKAYASAVASYLKSEDYGSAVRSATSWLVKYPKSKGAHSTLRSVATELLIAGEFARAVDVFERLGVAGTDPDALETAARIAEGINEPTRATLLLQAFLKVYPKSANRPAAQLSLARLLERQGKESDAAQHYKVCADVSSVVAEECGARLADLFLKFKDRDRAKRHFKLVSARGAQSRSGQVSPYVGYARYRLAELEEEELEPQARSNPLALPESHLQKALGQRLKVLERLKKSYLGAVEAGGPWGIAALYRLARWVNHFADEVDAIQPPSGATEAQAKGFQSGLSKVSGPLRQLAVKSWADAYQRTTRNEILSPVVPEIHDRLSDFRVGGFFRAQGFRGRLRLAGLSPDGGKDGRGTAISQVRKLLISQPKNAQAWVDYGNLLIGEDLMSLASLAYQRALELDSKNKAALNNRAVVLITGESQEDWIAVAEANHLLKRAGEIDPFFVPGKFNRASLLNYYRVFRAATPLWDQVLLKSQSADAKLGQAIALQGQGRLKEANGAFARAVQDGDRRVASWAAYHEAARQSSGPQCRESLDRADSGSLEGFERQAYERLKAFCQGGKP